MKQPAVAVALAAAVLLAGCGHRTGASAGASAGPRSDMTDPSSRHPTGHYPRGGVVPTASGQDVGPQPSRGWPTCVSQSGKPSSC